MVFISFIVATYNCISRVDSLAETVKSLEGLDVEFLVSDGGSSDGTVDAVSQIQGVTIVSKEPDKGIYEAWNRALGVARGKYISFIGIDDTPLEEFVIKAQQRVEILGSYPAFIYGDAMMKYEDRITTRVTPSKPKLFYAVRPVFDIVHQGTLHLNVLFRGMKFNEDFVISGDYHFLLSNRENIKQLGILKIDSNQALVQLGGISDSFNSKLIVKNEYNLINDLLDIEVADLATLKSKVISVFSKYPTAFNILRRIKWKLFGSYININKDI